MSNEGLSLADVAESAATLDEDSGLVLLRDLGRNLVNYLFMSCRTLAIHAAGNAATREPVRRLQEVLRDLSTQVQKTHLIAVEGQLYLNDLRIKMDAAAYGNATYVVEMLAKHGIGGITFDAAPSEEDLRALLLLLLQHRPPKGGPEEALVSVKEALEQSDLPHIEFDRPYFYKAGGESSSGGAESSEEANSAEQAVLNYTKGVLAVKDYFRAVEAAEAANPLRIRKIVQDMVDVADDSPDDFLRLHTSHGIEDAYYNHCVNVATLSMALGRELQSDRIEMADLAACAMFHDLGYAAIERGSTQGDAILTDDERMRAHPIAGFKALLKQGEFGLGLLRRLLVTLEHHMHVRRPGGYPNLGRKKLSVFTRIVQLADHYDALVSPVGEDPPLLPVKALERIVASAGVAFDPLCVKILVRVVGRYPYGSLVKLNTGEVGVVTSAGRTSETFLKPRVMVVRDEDGAECRPREVDLAARGLPRRRVASVLNPFDEGVTPHAVLWDGMNKGEEDDEEPSAPDVVGVAAQDAPTLLPGVPVSDEGPPQVEESEEERVQRLLDALPDWDDEGEDVAGTEVSSQPKDPWAAALARSPSSGSLSAAPSPGSGSPEPPDDDEELDEDEDEGTGGIDGLIVILEQMARSGSSPTVSPTPQPSAVTDQTLGAEPIPEALDSGGWSPDDGFLPSSDDLQAITGDFDDHDVPELGTHPPEEGIALRPPPPPPILPRPSPVTPLRQTAVAPHAAPVPPPPTPPAASAATDRKAIQRAISEAFRTGGEAAVQELMARGLGGPGSGKPG